MDKKPSWKWTTGKIIAFTLLGLILVGLIYFESSSDEATDLQNIPLNEVSVEDPSFEERYREFLKKGEKYVINLDSIDQRQAAVSDNGTLGTETVDQDDLPVQTIPRPNNQRSANNNNRLIEVTPSSTTTTQNPSSTVTVPADDSIVEEFYTEVTVTGNIISGGDGSPISGVNVMVKGTNRSTVSDFNGNYSIVVPGNPEHRTIQYSYRGNLAEREVSPTTKVLNIRF